MPQEPKRRHSKERKGKRRASIKFKLPNITFCPNCKSPTLLHQVCRECGFYKGRQVLVVEKQKDKKNKDENPS